MEHKLELSPRDRAGLAVADAMMLMLHRMMAWDFKNWDNPDYVPSYDTAPPGEIPYSHEIVYLPRDFDEILKARSNGKCLRYTELAALYLHVKHGDLFKHELIIHGTPSKTDHWYQYYFLTEDTTGMWRAGSPANYTPDEPVSRLTNVITAPSLKTTLDKVQELEGGKWPSVQMINSVLGNYEPPIVETNYKGEPYRLRITQIGTNGSIRGEVSTNSLHNII